MQTAADTATCVSTGIDPFTKEEVYITRQLRDPRMQRALLQFFKPENYFAVRQALIEPGRQDLIGGCGGLIPDHPPKEALNAHRERANEQSRGEYVHMIRNQASNKGYRPGRKSAQRRPERNQGGRPET